MSLRLVKNADTEHEDARGWYDNYGWHLTTRHAGDVCLQAVEYNWLDKDDDRVIEMLRDAYSDRTDEDGKSRLTRDEAESLIVKAREIRDIAESVEAELQAAVEAYELGDLDGVQRALNDARNIESEHGDEPAVRALRAQLIEEANDDETDDEPTTVTCRLCGDETPAVTAHRHQDGWVGDECWDERLRSTE